MRLKTSSPGWRTAAIVSENLHVTKYDVVEFIVTLFEKRPPAPAAAPQADAELVTIADRRSLIVVNRSVLRTLPGVNIIPLNGNRAFLALEPGRGMADLELAVIDRLDNRAVKPRERKALRGLGAQLKKWRHDRVLRFHTRAIIVVERVKTPRVKASSRAVVS